MRDGTVAGSMAIAARILDKLPVRDLGVQPPQLHGSSVCTGVERG